MLKRFAIWVGILFLSSPLAASESKQAIFAGGCFWCMEAEFKGVDGVSSVTSGYAGGTVANPTYAQVSAGGTGHVEAIQVTFDPEKISYARLLKIFWGNVDPTDEDGQFCDKGTQYRAGIFTFDSEQAKLAEESKADAQKRFGAVATFVKPATVFYPAEDYHQEYFIKNKTRYKLYKLGCGRDARLDELKGRGAKPD